MSINQEMEEKTQILKKKILLCAGYFKKKVFQLQKDSFLQKELSLYSKKEFPKEDKSLTEANLQIKKLQQSIEKMEVKSLQYKDQEQKLAELQWENELLKKRLELRGDASEHSQSKIELSEDNEPHSD